MLSYQNSEVGQSAYVVDSFERTSNRDVEAARNRLKEQYEKDRGRSRVRDLLERYETMSNWLNELYSVPDDWNAYGSPAPTKPSIEISRGVLNSLWVENLIPDRALPSAEGGVALIFRTENDNRAVIETQNDLSTYVLLYDRKGNSRTLDWSDPGPARSEALRQLERHLKGASLAA
jgi:hypothetical protein